MASSNTSPLDWQVQYPKVNLRNAHLLRWGEWADCTFEFQTSGGAGAEGSKHSLAAHRLILASASPVFAAMFYRDTNDNNSPVVISDIESSTFSKLLIYIYTDAVNISDVDAALSLYKAANKYILVHLQRECLEYILKNLNPDNVCLIYEFSCFFSEDKLKQECLKMFGAKTQYVLKGPSFQNAHVSTLKEIVLMDTLDINSEMDLYNALQDYVGKLKNSDDIEEMEIQFSQVDKMEDEESYKDANDQDNNNNSDNDNSEPSGINTSQKQFKTVAEARRILHGIIEEIRFLSMTSADLAKIGENSAALLSKNEILALFINLSSPNSIVPMPVGFSCLREPRIRGAITFREKMDKISEMVVNSGTRHFSTEPGFLRVRNLRWRIFIKRESRIPPDEYLALYIQYNEDDAQKLPSFWTCAVECTVTLLSNSVAKPNLTKTSEKLFESTRNNVGFPQYIKWEELLNPENSFIKDDSITFEVHILMNPISTETTQQS